MKKVCTLCLVVDSNKVLLGMKKRGFGEGRWNGFGGKVEENEEIIEGAKRELLEESGVRAKAMDLKGILEFEYLDDDKILEVHVFKVGDYEGRPMETEEMRPRWFDVHQIPFEEMWPDDLYWLPLFLKDKNFRGRFVFEDKVKIISHDLKILDD
ncbi:MAG: 8-oxo-dGTP diphosphatase [Candidatus Paceibacterota bacterium]|jgi:8-oxo-dGTP diphosphatase/2-hydroxy-dATP diphosphatase|nr:8-oxo-dGTP diphosphatase [Candidatus Paceibacterota bacterium]MDD5555105.1 8-oxo-dGTP diphosphatase [Candidatus Paceibacterota bacterium]